MQPGPFRDSVRCHFNLPQIPTDHAGLITSEAAGCQLAICATCKDKRRDSKDPRAREIDPTGDHASSGCHPCSGPRYRLHNGVRDVLRDFAIEAGLQATNEPATSSLLLDDFNDEQCRLMFPKEQTRETKRLAERAGVLAIEIADLEDRIDVTRETNAKRFKLRELQLKLSDNVQGRRIDLHIVDSASQDSRWIDVAGVHPTCATYRKKTIKFVRKLQEAELRAEETMTANPMAKISVALIESTEGRKETTYSLLTALADNQKRLRRRQGEHKFVPAVFTHNGELSPKLFDLVEWLSLHYKTHSASLDFTHGRAAKQLSAEFRTRLKDALQTAIANGYGAMLRAAGLPKPRGVRGNLQR
jgi:hypothetical protein